ncbi:helix-turn-helix domain-containing protein [Streptomyces poriferorum]|uniref:Helix-turn-helix domain-containing protein n=1 Tax=Streptomyces poriferorum TaxID=2798799 RepID=A0ABY9IY33_9ACTN|nr:MULTISPECIES: helix-turn-helix domain-containing protein [unclassified Streptomyces]MDP5310434.1 helix-turn-helix domain-containing protein [Streptomyces sp. Alt4]WLQ60412.1 helix-turn-helix domain-containing protein [Streptomyces sp. Alt2]
MNTTTAAGTAKVTVATIRDWARRGIIAATKVAGRWVIDTTSLARRIAIGAMKRPAHKVIYSVATMTAIGGNRWQRNGMDRVYFNNWAELAGIETTRYNTGNISSASYQGEGVSNSQAYKLLGCIDKVWFDTADGKLHARYGYDESRAASREEVWDAVAAGIRTAIAAL